MRIKNLYAQLALRAVWAIVAIIATVTTFTDHVSVANGGDGRPTTLFFTTWSVWLVAVVALPIFVATLIKVIKKEKEGYNTILPALKFCADIMIIATFIISGFVLKMFFDSFGSVFKHFLLPIITIADAVLFDDVKTYRVSYPLLAVIIPLLYWIIVITRNLIYRNACGGAIPEAEWLMYYPYNFTNFDNGHSIGGLIGMLGGILAGLILLGYGFWALDKLRKNDEGKIIFDMKIEEDKMTDFIHLIKTKLNKNNNKQSE